MEHKPALPLWGGTSLLVPGRRRSGLSSCSPSKGYPRSLPQPLPSHAPRLQPPGVPPSTGGGRKRVSASPPPGGLLKSAQGVGDPRAGGPQSLQGTSSNQHDDSHKSRFYWLCFTSEEMELRGHKAMFSKLIWPEKSFFFFPME